MEAHGAFGENHFMWQPGDEQRHDSEGLWSEVQSYDRRSFHVACSIRDRHGAELFRHDGLVEAHAYSRDPCGERQEVERQCRDDDVSWARMPAVRLRLRPVFRNDDAFWIAWSDGQAIFDFVYECGRSMRTAEAAREHAKLPSDVMWVAAKPRAARRVEALPQALPVQPPGDRVEMRTPEYLEGRIAEARRLNCKD